MTFSFDTDQLSNLGKYTRANFIHSLVGYKSPVLIGSGNTGGQLNLANFNSIFHVGSNPPLIGKKFRLKSTMSHTYKNYKHRQECTINLENLNIYKKANQTSARYESAQDEFKASV